MTPNFKDPRNLRRAEKVLDWASEFVVGKYGSIVPLSLSAKGFKKLDERGEVIYRVPGLEEIFGPKGNATGDYLRDLLLHPVSKSYIPGEKARTYSIKSDGYSQLEALVRPESALVLPYTVSSAESAVERLIRRHASELSSLTFSYKDSSDRLWHPLQNIRNRRTETYTGPIKREFWQKFGLPHDYDLVACAPTILFQLATRAGAPAILLEGLKAYLDDRTAFRSHVAALTGLDHDDAKRLINSLFNGAKLGCNQRWSTYQLLDCDLFLMTRLMNDPQVRRLHRSIKSVWALIQSSRAITMRPGLLARLSGDISEPWKLKTSRAKWSLYFQYERAVLDVIRAHVVDRGIRFFTEHDGFRTDREIEITELEAEILLVTGLEMSIEQKKTGIREK
jgi:hypothetical protein